MDERTRRTDKDLAPGARRRLIPEPLAPWAPWIRGRPRSRMRTGIGILVLLVLAFGIYETARWVRSAPPPGGRFPQGAVQTVGASTAALGDVRVALNELGTVTPLATGAVQTPLHGQPTGVGFTQSPLV